MEDLCISILNLLLPSCAPLGKLLCLSESVSSSAQCGVLMVKCHEHSAGGECPMNSNRLLFIAVAIFVIVVVIM